MVGLEPVWRRVLGSPNHQFWDPMILRAVTNTSFSVSTCIWMKFPKTWSKHPQLLWRNVNEIWLGFSWNDWKTWCWANTKYDPLFWSEFGQKPIFSCHFLDCLSHEWSRLSDSPIIRLANELVFLQGSFNYQSWGDQNLMQMYGNFESFSRSVALLVW